MNPIHGLYGVTPAYSEKLIVSIELALKGGMQVLQYRDKSLGTEERLNNAQIIRELCNKYSACFIVNDDVSLAMKVDADGVHIGKDDGDIAQVRQHIGGKILGISCYNSLDNAKHAQELGADYVAFGRFFPSKTKPHAVPAGIDLIHLAKSQLMIPVVAIGGITLNNASALIETGADAIAVIDGLFHQPDVEATARKFVGLFNKN